MTVVERTYRLTVCSACGLEAPFECEHMRRAQGTTSQSEIYKSIEVVPAELLEGSVSLTDDEWERVNWWLQTPVPPGPYRDLDCRIIAKIAQQRGRR